MTAAGELKNAAGELRLVAIFDWLYAGRMDKLHAPVAAVYDPTEWNARDVTFACGWTADVAWIPGVGSRVSLPRCSRCCDALGMPRGSGSPKNDDACRAVLGLPPESTNRLMPEAVDPS